MTNLKLNLKLFATAALLLCLWQDAKCGNITIINCLHELKCGKGAIKYKILTLEKGITSKTADVVVKHSEKSKAFKFDPSTQKLWVSLYYENNYTEIIISNSDKDYTVLVTELYPTGSSVYEIRTSMPVGEPVFCACGSNVKGMYITKGFFPMDISFGFPQYTATFNYVFDDTITSRITLVSGKNLVHPEYVIQFPPSAELSTTERSEIARIFDIDLSSVDLYNQLSDWGFEISITACAFSLKDHDFAVSTLKLNGGERVFVGLFNSRNVIAGSKNPISIDNLVLQSASVLGCQLTANVDVGSFDVVAIAEDCRHIWITRVLVGPKCDEFANLFNANSFSQSLCSLVSYAKSYKSPDDKVLLDMVYSLAKMSGKPIDQSKVATMTSSNYTSQSKKALSTTTL